MQSIAPHPDPSAPEEVPRRGPDRRTQPTPRLSRYALLGGRRGSVRRADEREGSFVDRYGFGVVLAIGWTALMNAGDSVFTLVHLQSGGIELNPVADSLLQTGRLGFVALKALLMTAALLVLVDVMKEMPATLLLRPFGWDTLAVRIYELTSEGEWERAAMPAVALVAVGLVPVILLVRRSARG